MGYQGRLLADGGEEGQEYNRDLQRSVAGGKKAPAGSHKHTASLKSRDKSAACEAGAAGKKYERLGLTCNHRAPLSEMRLEPSHEARTCRAVGEAAVAMVENRK